MLGKIMIGVALLFVTVDVFLLTICLSDDAKSYAHHKSEYFMRTAGHVLAILLAILVLVWGLL